jgi:hypothetical protein
MSIIELALRLTVLGFYVVSNFSPAERLHRR